MFNSGPMRFLALCLNSGGLRALEIMLNAGLFGLRFKGLVFALNAFFRTPRRSPEHLLPARRAMLNVDFTTLCEHHSHLHATLGCRSLGLKYRRSLVSLDPRC